MSQRFSVKAGTGNRMGAATTMDLAIQMCQLVLGLSNVGGPMV